MKTHIGVPPDAATGLGAQPRDDRWANVGPDITASAAPPAWGRAHARVGRCGVRGRGSACPEPPGPGDRLAGGGAAGAAAPPWRPVSGPSAPPRRRSSASLRRSGRRWSIRSCMHEAALRLSQRVAGAVSAGWAKNRTRLCLLFGFANLLTGGPRRASVRWAMECAPRGGKRGASPASPRMDGRIEPTRYWRTPRWRPIPGPATKRPAAQMPLRRRGFRARIS